MSETKSENNPTFIDKFDDVKILQYRFESFRQLPLSKKILLYYLSRAALSGRDIIYDQNYRHNLIIRKSLEIIYKKYQGERETGEFIKFHNYLKKIWFANGIHHPYSKEKIQPEFDKDYLGRLINQTFHKGLDNYFTKEQDAIKKLTELIFNPDIAPLGVSQSGDAMIENSAVNFYEDVFQEDAERFYNEKFKEEPRLSHGLNSKLSGSDGHLQEITWYKNGMYGQAIEQILTWLRKALDYTENEAQKQWLEALVNYYETGDLKAFNDYNISWVRDTSSHVDLINGFIETYSDPLGLKGTWESIVHIKDEKATKRTEILSQNAQWFEDNAPINDEFKKKEVTGVTATVVDVAILGGESYPTSPIGVNLPNADWIRKEHGSKSITLQNISLAHHEAMAESGLTEEFAWSEEEVMRSKQYGFLANNLHTDLHECLGHGSGKMKPGIKAEMLKNYQSPIEEARADLFALYYLMDEKLLELGILPTTEAAKAQYDAYIRNGLLTQLSKVKKGKNLEQAHMKNRQLIALWCYEQGKKENIIEKKTKNRKTYFIIRDHQKLRQLFGELLAGIQRIKSEGDYSEARFMVETYGTKIDPVLHEEVLERYNKLHIPPFTGFINPDYLPEYDSNGKISDIKLQYPENYSQQMLDYSKNYSFLSTEN
jgi:dipeptidyl-peptidase-3